MRRAAQSHRFAKPISAAQTPCARVGIRNAIFALCVAALPWGGGGLGCAATSSRGAPWTILCLELDGRNAAENVNQVAETLRRSPSINERKVIVRHDMDGFSRLYYGTYQRHTDPKTGKRSTSREMDADLRMIRGFGTPDGRYMFQQPLRVRLPLPDVGNPDWALVRAHGVYTLQVAAFEPTDDFLEHKQAAAQYCALLRERGHEAYFHHAKACSMVTVGAFGPEAIYTDNSGRSRFSAQVRALQRHEDLRYHLTNGALFHPIVDGKPAAPVLSQLMQIPNREPVAP